MKNEFFKNVIRILTEKYLADFSHCPLFLQIFDFIGHFLATQLNFVLSLNKRMKNFEISIRDHKWVFFLSFPTNR